MTRNQKFLSLIAIVFCFLFPHYGGGILVYPIVVSLVVTIFLRKVAQENLHHLLFSFNRFQLSSVLVGVIGAIGLSAFFRFAWDPLINIILPNSKIDLSDFDYITGNLENYIFVLVLALVVGGFYEEIIFHGFIFTRFEKIFPGKHSTTMAFLLTTLLFGLYHYQQGIKGVLLTMIAGAVYHLLIIKFKRNLWYGIFIHTFFDFIGLTWIYLGYL